MKYSICATNYNTERVIEKHLDSIFRFITPQDFEVVIVDNKSTDNSPKILRKYAKDYGNMKVISKKCLRGHGRQIAFEYSSGEYIIQVDTDTIYIDQNGRNSLKLTRKKILISLFKQCSQEFFRDVSSKKWGDGEI